MAAARRHIRAMVRDRAIHRRLSDPTNPLEVFSADEIKDRFRFNPDTIMYLARALSGDLVGMTMRSLPVIIQLCIALRFMATGSFLVTVGDCFNVSKATAFRAVKDVLNAIVHLLHHHVAFPRGADAVRTKHGFYQIAGK